MANNLSISVTADIVDLVAKRAQMSAELQAAQKDLKSFVNDARTSGATDELRAGMLAAATATAEMQQKLAATNAELKNLRATALPAIEEVKQEFAGASISIREMGVQLRETFGVIGEMREAMMAFAEAAVAALALEQIHQFAERMGEAAEKTAHLAETFGMTVGEVQQLGGIATATGISIDAIVKGMGILDKNMVASAGSATTAGNALKAVGIAANDGRTQMQLLEGVADKFKSMDDGPKKVALAMALFGKSGKDLIPILDLGAEGIAEINRKSEEYGVVNEQAVAKGDALAESMNEQKLAMAGVSNVLTDALAPMLKVAADAVNALIKAFVDSYREGGIVAQVFTAIQEVVSVVGTVIEALAEIFKALWDIVQPIVSDIGDIIAIVFGIQFGDHMKSAANWINVFKDVFVVAKDVIIVVIEVIGSMIERLVGYLKAMAIVADDAFHLKWGAIEADWNRGMAVIENRATEAANRIKSAMAEAAAAVAAASKGEALPSGAEETGIKLPKGGDGGDLGFTGGGHKQKKHKTKDDLVQKLEEELTAKKLAWDEQQDAQDSAQRFSLESERDFWAQALEVQNLSAKDRAAIETKLLAVKSEIRKEEIAKAIEGYRQELDAAGQNWAAKLKILEDEKAYIVQKYGAESKEAAAAQTAIVKATQEAAKQREQIEQNHSKAVEQLELLKVDAAEQAAEFEVQIGRRTKQQLLAEEKQFENQRYAIRLAALQKEMATVSPDRDPVKYGQINAQIEQLEQQHQNKLTQLDRKGAAERAQSFGQLRQGWSQTLAQMLTLQTGFMSGIRSLWQGFQQFITSILAQIVEEWLIKHGVMTAIGKLFGIHDVSTSAGRAAAAAYASTAAIPIIGPGLAPAAAAAAGAGAMGMGLGLMSAEGGDWEVSPGLYELHRNEMVLPAWAASPLRSMIQSGTGMVSPTAANDASGGGDQHNHFHFHGAVLSGTRELDKWAKRSRSALGAGVKEYARQGGR